MKLYKLESVRGFAAFYVVLHHLIPHDLVLLNVNIGIIFRFGQEAVILFFLLSGFVINYSFKESSHKDFKTYFFKRFTRIYIPLIFVFLLGYLYEALSNGYMVAPQLGVLIGNMFMLQDTASLKPGVIVAPYMNNSPLWSLSYEWWFYMLYFPIVSYFQSIANRNYFVFGLSVLFAALYMFFPMFLIRLVMYFAIWWVGVIMSDLYLSDKEMALKNMTLPLVSIVLICVILSISVVSNVNLDLPLSVGVYPILELRHMLFSLFIVISSFIWARLRWFGFDVIFKPFLFIAPVSYLIYISHIYLVVDASYLDFLANKPLEYFGYFVCLFLFSYTIELIAYPAIRRVAYNRFLLSK